MREQRVSSTSGAVFHGAYCHFFMLPSVFRVHLRQIFGADADTDRSSFLRSWVFFALAGILATGIAGIIAACFIDKKP